MNISLQNFDLKVPGKTLLHDTTIKVSQGCKYGLVGLNGSGKTTLLKSLINLEAFKQFNTLLVEQELPNEHVSVYNYILNSNESLARTVSEYESLNEDDNDYLDKYHELEERLEFLDYNKQQSIISKILAGLGFTTTSQTYNITDFSGGWRMRIALAKALYIQPDILLLDEPSNHLDINAVLWLTQYLQTIKSTIIMISHNQHLLDCVCNWIMYLDTHTHKIIYFKGDYTQFYNMHTQLQDKYQSDWDKLCKTVKQLKTKQEREEAISKSGLIKPQKPYRPRIIFKEPDKLKTENPLTLYNVGLQYPNKTEFTIQNVSFHVNTDTRICIVGYNGSGKSTFMKILSGDLTPTTGEIIRDSRLKIGFYHQNSADSLNHELTPIECIITQHTNVKEFEARKMLGSIGLEGPLHTTPLSQLSGGQKARVAFCCVISSEPHILLLDEPTNHLDIETVNALIQGINEYTGGVVMITHDEKIVMDTNCILWVCEHGSVYKYNGAYEDYKYDILSL